MRRGEWHGAVLICLCGSKATCSQSGNGSVIRGYVGCTSLLWHGSFPGDNEGVAIAPQYGGADSHSGIDVSSMQHVVMQRGTVLGNKLRGPRILHARCGALHVVRCQLLLEDVVPGMINPMFTRWGGEVRSARSWRVAPDIRPIRTAQIRRLIICLELQDGGTGNGFRYLQTLRFSSSSLFLLLALLGRLGLGCRQLELWGIRRY
jgi:hypothetical protein